MNWKDKTALVTGGAGFIGSHLSDALVNLGANVIIADVFSLISIKNIDHIRDKLTLVDIDVSKKQDIGKINENIDFIFHLAAYAAPNLCEKNPEVAFKVNVQGTFNVLNFALDCGVKKVVFPSSALLYGRNPKYLPIDENHPIEISNNVYNTTKKIGEDLCETFYEKHGLPVIYFRLFNSFGPRQPSDYFIPTVILQALKNNTIELWNDKPTRDFTYVKDTVNALIKGAETNYCGGSINIGSGRESKVGDIAKQIADSFGAKINFLNKEVIGSLRLCCNNRKAQKILGWTIETSFEDGLNETIEWYKQHASFF